MRAERVARCGWARCAVRPEAEQAGARVCGGSGPSGLSQLGQTGLRGLLGFWARGKEGDGDGPAGLGLFEMGFLSYFSLPFSILLLKQTNKGLNSNTNLNSNHTQIF